MRSLRSAVYGNGVAQDDPAEIYHESSKAYPGFLAREVPGVARLEADTELQAVVRRSARTHATRRPTALPLTELPAAELGAVIRDRRSRRAFGPAPVPLATLGTILQTAYGVTHEGSERLRSVPSGGALYPLEVYVAGFSVDGIARGLYHYDPFRHAIEALSLADHRDELRAAMVYPELADAAFLVFLTGVFWRSRFKYGLRAYRFALLEAGHVMQNVLLACAACELAAVPIGGFFDARLERLLGVDGVDESVIYGAAIGHPDGE